MSTLPFSPAADRNKGPILEVLQQLLPASGRALELASGTGQHAAWFGAGLPGWTWQPTEANPSALPTIAAWVGQSQVHNVRAPCLLDVMEPDWPSDDETLASAFDHPFDLIFCANLLHISPWSTCEGLMGGAQRMLARPGGQLILYGPFLEDGMQTAPGNLGFDESLRLQNPVWGLRHREAVEETAQRHGLQRTRRIEMPANNLLLVFAHN